LRRRTRGLELHGAACTRRRQRHQQLETEQIAFAHDAVFHQRLGEGVGEHLVDFAGLGGAAGQGGKAAH
jgi:hypothetical protein